MPRSRFPTPPIALREALGEDGYEYLTQVHEHLYGVDNGGGQLDATNLGVSGAGQLRIEDGGGLSAGSIRVDEIAASADGPLVSSDGVVAPGKMGPQYIEAGTSGSTLRTSDGETSWATSLDTTVDGAATLKGKVYAAQPTPPKGPGVDGQYSDDVRMYSALDALGKTRLYIQAGKSEVDDDALPTSDQTFTTKNRTISLELEDGAHGESAAWKIEDET